MAQSSVLYRKYRPTKLADVIGQEHITKVLSKTLEGGKVSHAYLFIGPRGTGKTSVARIFAHAVNDFPYEIEDSYLDIVEIDAASNTGVDNIRELREKAIIAPTKGEYKVYIIDEVHMLTKSAANALLKTLEEPPAHVIFILATTDAHKVPITISSRAQVFQFQLADPSTMAKHLRQIAKAENINITDDALSIVVRRGGGSFRDSLSLLDQIATLSGDEITADIINSALGLPADQLIADILTAYQVADFAKVAAILHDFLKTGLAPTVFASEIIAKIVASPTPELLPLLAKLPSVSEPFSEAKLLLALLEGQNSALDPNLRGTAVHAENPPKRPETAQKADFTPKNADSVSKTAENMPKMAETTANPPKITPKSAEDFSWSDFLAQIEQLNLAVHTHLAKAIHEVKNGELHLYPIQSFSKKILETAGNRQLLTQALPDMAIVIHDLDDPKPAQNPTISQISAIMGNVQEVSDDAPF